METLEKLQRAKTQKEESDDNTTIIKLNTI